ncbi:MAG: hypothetical protein JW741_11260 [Sedimentisphaerales bacterium]|nr:hypothetical protein [Sedimentisphaerales bacterium]
MTVKKRILLKFLSATLENAFLLGAMGFTVYILLTNQFQGSRTDCLLQWIITLLGLLAVSLLVERLGKLRRMDDRVAQIHEHFLSREGKPSADLIFSNRKLLSPLEDRLDSARHIDVNGGSLFRLTSGYIGYFQQKAADGCRLRFLLVDPDSEAAKILARHVCYEIQNLDEYVGHIRTSLANLLRLKQEYSKLVDIRVYDCVPPFGLLISDPRKPCGQVQAEIYSFAVPIRERPEFTLTAAHDPRYFDFFVKQYEAAWGKAKVYTGEGTQGAGAADAPSPQDPPAPRRRKKKR